jgi:hypothetical protein
LGVGKAADIFTFRGFSRLCSQENLPPPSVERRIRRGVGMAGTQAPISVLHRAISKRWAPFSATFPNRESSSADSCEPCGRVPDVVGSRLPRPYHFPARIQSFQAFAAPFPGDSVLPSGAAVFKLLSFILGLECPPPPGQDRGSQKSRKITITRIMFSRKKIPQENRRQMKIAVDTGKRGAPRSPHSASAATVSRRSAFDICGLKSSAYDLGKIPRWRRHHRRCRRSRA